MPGRPLSAAQLQHNRDIAKRGGQATAAKYGGYHFAHVARSARAHGTYSPPPIKAPFAALRAKQAAARLSKGQAKNISAGSVLGRVARTKVGTPGRTALPRTGLSRTSTKPVTRKRRAAVR